MDDLSGAPHGSAIRIIHTADLHLGAGLQYGKVNPATGLHQRLEDYLGTLDQMVDVAIGRDVDVFLVAGDIYHSKTPAPALTNEFAKRVRRLTQAGIEVVLLAGNHDGVGIDTSATALDVYDSLEFKGVTILRKPQIANVATKRGMLQVAAMPHLSKSVLEARRTDMLEGILDANEAMADALASMIAALAAQVNPAIPSVLAAHLTIDVATVGSEGSMMVGRGVALPLEAVQLPEFNYVALGHIHKAQVWEDTLLAVWPRPIPPVVYPGSPDRVSFDEAEDDKGFWVVDVEVDCTTRMERIPLNVRRFVDIKVDLTTTMGSTSWLVEAINEEEVSGAIVRLAYTIEASRASMIDEAAIHEALADAFAFVIRPNIVQADARVRDPEMAEKAAGDPREALERYIDSSPEMAPRRDVLLKRAEALIASLAGESAVLEAVS